MKQLTSDQATRWVAANPEAIYALVSDVTRTPEWSPEVVECPWLDGAEGASQGCETR